MLFLQRYQLKIPLLIIGLFLVAALNHSAKATCTCEQNPHVYFCPESEEYVEGEKALKPLVTCLKAHVDTGLERHKNNLSEMNDPKYMSEKYKENKLKDLTSLQEQLATHFERTEEKLAAPTDQALQLAEKIIKTITTDRDAVTKKGIPNIIPLLVHKDLLTQTISLAAPLTAMYQDDIRGWLMSLFFAHLWFQHCKPEAQAVSPEDHIMIYGMCISKVLEINMELIDQYNHDMKQTEASFPCWAKPMYCDKHPMLHTIESSACLIAMNPLQDSKPNYTEEYQPYLRAKRRWDRQFEQIDYVDGMTREINQSLKDEKSITVRVVPDQIKDKPRLFGFTLLNNGKIQTITSTGMLSFTCDAKDIGKRLYTLLKE